MTPRSTCGIVLRVAAHRESDKLVTLLSQDLGRVTGLAKGAMNSTHRFVNKLEEFTLLQVGYRSPRGTSGLLLLTEADLLRSHLGLRRDYRLYATAMYLCELVLRFTKEHDPDPRLFNLMQWALASLESGAGPLKTAALFHLLLLTSVGYRPTLDRCTACQGNIGPERTFALLPGHGGLLCNACQPGSKLRSHHLSIQTLKLLDSAQAGSPEWLNRLRLPEHAAAEALEALCQYSLHLLQQDIRSWKTLRTCFQQWLVNPPAKSSPVKKTGMVHAAFPKNRDQITPSS